MKIRECMNDIQVRFSSYCCAKQLNAETYTFHKHNVLTEGGFDILACLSLHDDGSPADDWKERDPWRSWCRIASQLFHLSICYEADFATVTKFSYSWEIDETHMIAHAIQTLFFIVRITTCSLRAYDDVKWNQKESWGYASTSHFYIFSLPLEERFE